MALAAITAADYGKQHVDWSHVPCYNFDWESQGEGKGYGGYGKDDSYGEVLRYGQKETRSKDDTETTWWTDLPGKSHIKRTDQVHAQQHVSYTNGHDSYEKKDDYKNDDYKKY